jgi:hypothetical protein
VVGPRVSPTYEELGGSSDLLKEEEQQIMFERWIVDKTLEVNVASGKMTSFSRKGANKKRKVTAAHPEKANMSKMARVFI